MALGTVDKSSTVRGVEQLGYQPGLDGIRGLALIGIVAYHSGVDAIPGGFLGVSSFLTLSGFLITRLLLEERDRTGGVDLPAFWGRRVRRLLPALVVVVAVIGVTTPFWADPSQVSRLGSDSVASMFYVANWWFIGSGDSYGALFADPSPMRHLWSLAVEEQFYLIFPPLMLLALGATRNRPRALVGAVVALTGAAALLPIVGQAAGWSVDRLYFGTDTRFAELMVGVALATWWTVKGRGAPRPSPPLTLVGLTVVAVMAWIWGTVHTGDTVLYRGGLFGYALLTAVLIVVVIADEGAIRRLFSVPALVRIGLYSYGAYLIHWPIVLWLESTTGLGPEARMVVTLVLTLPLAALSYRFVEQPVRKLAPEHRRRAVLLVPAGVVVVVLALMIAARAPEDPADIDFVAAQDRLEELLAAGASRDGVVADATGAGSPVGGVDGDMPSKAGSPDPRTRSATASAPPAEVVTLGAVEHAPPKIAVFGDSTAMMTALGMATWASEEPEVTAVDGATVLGCGLVPAWTRILEGEEDIGVRKCEDPLVTWPSAASANGADVAVIQLGAWEVVDQQLVEGGPFQAVGRDAGFDAVLTERLTATTDRLLEMVELVVIVTGPDTGRLRIEEAGEFPEYTNERTERFREIERSVASANEAVVVVPLDEWIAGRPDDDRLRPDGVHFSWDTAGEVARSYLGPAILDRWRDHTAR